MNGEIEAQEKRYFLHYGPLIQQKTCPHSFFFSDLWINQLDFKKNSSVCES